ncbi:MAG TPA: isochorismatase family cysteine hydrolase [Isosphaeraceae bacterium]|nr:isochorismatase family cysteine hydrolase [Isosphaeraceae bacterium]
MEQRESLASPEITPSYNCRSGCERVLLNPKHSGFFSTTLDILLEYLGTKTVILTGIAGNICVLFTANDAYMRDFSLIVPCDCVVSNTEQENGNALEQMRKVLKADVRPSAELVFAASDRREAGKARAYASQ